MCRSAFGRPSRHLFALVESPHAARLVRFDSLARYRLDQLLEDRVGSGAVREVPSLPRPAFVLLLFPQVALQVLDFGFLNVNLIHVGLLDPGDDMLPSAIRFHGVLLLDRGDL